MSEVQSELGFVEKPKVTGAAKAMVDLLKGAGGGENGWLTSAEILRLMDRPATEGNRRWLREIANQSQGEIASGQQGYKLVSEMTAEEYNHFRNWMKRQADEMTARILRSDKVFYRRRPMVMGNGILSTGGNGEGGATTNGHQ